MNPDKKATRPARSFQDLYDEARNAPTPRQDFLRRVAAGCNRSENAVLDWAKGRRTPDINTRIILGNLLHADPESLFPQKSN